MAAKKIKAEIEAQTPLHGLKSWEFIFCQQMAMGTAQHKAYMLAKPEVKADSAKSSAYLEARKPHILRATEFLRNLIPEARQNDFLMTKGEALQFLTNVVRTPLSELDDCDPMVTEKRKTVNANGVTEVIRKVDPLKAIEISAKLQGWEKDSGPVVNLTIAKVLTALRRPGLPQELEEGVIIDLENNEDDDV